MIIHPDFLDHRKTLKLIELSGTELAPLWLVRLWAYCQLQRAWSFPVSQLSPVELKHICRATIDAKKLFAILIECRWITSEQETLTVRDWDSHNRMLVSAWTNGKKGGYAGNFDNQSASGRHPGRQASGQAHSRARKRREDKIRAGMPVGIGEEERQEGKQGATLKLRSPLPAVAAAHYSPNETQPLPQDQRQTVYKTFAHQLKELAQQLKAK